jgi:cell division protein ZapA
VNKPGIKQVEVQIMGQSYLLACPHDGEAALLEAVQKVDGAMCRIRDAGKVKARDRIAVLASLNIAFELSQRDTSGFKNSSFGNTEPGPSDDTHPTLGSADELRLKQLLSRLDKALDKDGQLI